MAPESECKGSSTVKACQRFLDGSKDYSIIKEVTWRSDKGVSGKLRGG
jgi:hypothetical protein